MINIHRAPLLTATRIPLATGMEALPRLQLKQNEKGRDPAAALGTVRQFFPLELQ